MNVEPVAAGPDMRYVVGSTAQLRRLLDGVLSSQVRAMLRPAGFTKHGRTFRRTRRPLYDMINIQASKWNGVRPGESDFFVNIGVGSTEIDAVLTRWPRADGSTVREYVLDRRWEELAEANPPMVSYTGRTTAEDLAAILVDGLRPVLAVIDSLHTTDDLARWAVANNRLAKYEKTSRYLAATGHVDLLTTYIESLRKRFSGDRRWPQFNATLAWAAGTYAPQLTAPHLLDPTQSE